MTTKPKSGCSAFTLRALARISDTVSPRRSTILMGSWYKSLNPAWVTANCSSVKPGRVVVGRDGHPALLLIAEQLADDKPVADLLVVHLQAENEHRRRPAGPR